MNPIFDRVTDWSLWPSQMLFSHSIVKDDYYYARWLLNWGLVDVDTTFSVYRKSMLYGAKSADMALLLISRGCVVNDICRGGMTPLQNACYFGRSDVASVLLDFGARDQPNSLGMDAFRYAFRSQSLNVNEPNGIVNLLKSHGLEFDRLGKKDCHGRVALHWAASANDLEMVQAIVDFDGGATLFVRDTPSNHLPVDLVQASAGHKNGKKLQSVLKRLMAKHSLMTLSLARRNQIPLELFPLIWNYLK